MNEDNKNRIQKLASIFNTENIVSSSDMQEVLVAVIGLLTSFKENTDNLNTETRKLVSEMMSKVETAYEATMGNLRIESKNSKAEFNSLISEFEVEIKNILSEALLKKPKNGKDGKDGQNGRDADVQQVIKEVLSKIPAVKDLEPETGASMVQKINTLDSGNPDEQIDASHIKNLPKIVSDTAYKIAGSRLLEGLQDVNLSGLTKDSNGRWELGSGGSGSVDWGDIGGTLADQTDLQSAIDAKVADAITNGVTTIAPSENAVFDALALKEDLTNKSTNIVTDGASDTKYPSAKAVKTYADSLVAGLLDYRGAYDASVNTFPASGGSGTAGAILKGDVWVISVSGTLGSVAIQAGDWIIANVDTPAQTTGNWDKLNTNISYVAEDSANKVTSVSGASTDTQYPSAKLLYDQLALKQPIDSDLTTIAGLTATTDNFLVSVASAWASRTPAQVKTTLSLENVDNTSDATKNSASVTLTNKTITSPTITGATLTTSTLNSGSVAGYFMTTAMQANLSAPADGETRYYGSTGISPATTAQVEKMFIPATGTVRAVYVSVRNVGTTGTGETSTISFRLNDTTDTTISSSLVTNATYGAFNNTALSIAVTAGDYFEIKWVCPTWATNPTNVSIQATVYIN